MKHKCKDKRKILKQSDYSLSGYKRIVSIGNKSPYAVTELTVPGQDGIKDGDSLVASAAFSPDGYLVAAAFDSEVNIWRVYDGELVAKLTGHKKQVEGVAFSPNGNLIATVSRDNTARIWQNPYGKLVTELTGHEGWLTSVVFSPDGRLIATA